MKIRVLLFLCFLSQLHFSQNIPDSLYNHLRQDDAVKRLKALVQLAKAHAAFHKDSTFFYGKQALALGEELENKEQFAWALNYIGSAYYYHGQYDSAKHFHLQALEIRLKIDDKKGLGASYNNLGNIYDDEGDAAKALDYYQRAQKLFTEIGFDAGIAITYNSIGNLHYNRKNYRKALDYFRQAHDFHLQKKDTFSLIHSLNNMAIMYDELGIKDTALVCYQTTLQLAEQTKNTDAILVSLSNLSQILMEKGDLKKAATLMHRALALNESYGDSTQFISLYTNLALLFKKQNVIDSAIHYNQLALPIALRNGLRSSAIHNYQFLAELFARKGKFGEAYDMHVLYSLHNDTLLNEVNSRQVNEMETRFETAKKDKEIVKRNAEIKKAESESANHALQRNALIAGFTMLIALIAYLFYSYKKKKRVHREMAEQKMIIEEKQRDILDSIHYARRIQRSLLPNEKFLSQTLKRLMLGISFMLLSSNAWANDQKRIDSLLVRLEVEPVDSEKVNILRRLYRLHVSTDPDKAKTFLEQGLVIARRAGLIRREAGFLNGMGEYYRRKGDFEKAVNYYEQCRALSQTHRFQLEESWSYNNLGEVARMRGDYTLALKHYQRSLKIKEDLGDLKAVSSTLNNIGLIFLEQKKYKEALLYFERSLETRDSLGLRDLLATNYTNIGRIYYEKGNYLLALQYFQKSLELDREFNMPDEVMMDLNNISEMYVYLGKKDSALIIMQEALEIALRLGDTYQETLIRVNLGDQLLNTGKEKEAMLNYEKAVALGEKSGFRELLKDAYRSLAEMYHARGQNALAYEYHQQYTILKDSIYNAENLRIGNEMQAKYETEKKDKALIQKKADSEIALAEKEKTSMERNVMLGGVALGLILVFFVFRGFRQQQKDNRILQEQKEIIEEKQREILDSIRYARRIQRSLMPTEKAMLGFVRKSRG